MLVGAANIYNLSVELVHVLGNMGIYYINESVLAENRPLVTYIRNYIRDWSGVFSISSLVRISMTSLLAFTQFFVQKLSCLLNKKKITRALVRSE